MNYQIEDRNYTLEITCNACPEQYDLCLGNEIVGYFRLRHGCFTVNETETNENVFTGYPIGDGIFDPDERESFLIKGIEAVHNSIKG